MTSVTAAAAPFRSVANSTLPRPLLPEITRFRCRQPAYLAPVAEFDNVSLDVTAAVPERSTWAMIILDFAGVGFLGYRRKQDGGAFNAA